MKRFLILLAAFLMQMCLGATYAWSVFVRPIRDLTGVSQGIAQSPFTVFYFAFPLTLLFSGSILNALGARRSAVIGTLLFSLGWVLAGLGGFYSFAIVVIGIGMLSGIGVGIAYIVPITVSNHWFPRRPGLVTGIAVAGFAFGAALVGLGAEAMILGRGASPLQALTLLGTSFLVIGVPAAFQMEFPDRADVPSVVSPKRSELVRTIEFRQLFLGMVAGLAAGFAVVSNLKDLSPSADLGAGVTAVSVFAIANAVGRIAWGLVFDRVLPSSALRLNLFAQAVVVTGGLLLVVDLPSLLVFAGAAGFNYGGVLVLYASAAARRWGPRYLGQIYGLLFVANIVASPAAMAAGFSLDILGSFLPAFLVFAGFAVAAALNVGRPVNQRPTA